ncbi:hypothetical protein [Kitasatospora sp. NPDC001175]|uniref:hypothetical protein n=1 Tax=Kitasatospora sp. NPDC001175 TaxID=3157103 RepID=UPI003D04AD0F
MHHDPNAPAVAQLTDLIEQVIEHYTRELDDLNDLDIRDLAENIALQVAWQVPAAGVQDAEERS